MEKCPCKDMVRKPRTPAPLKDPEPWAECLDCGAIIWQRETYWQMYPGQVCFECMRPHAEAKDGYMTCAGLVFPELWNAI